MKNLLFLLILVLSAFCTRAPKLAVDRASANEKQIVGDGCEGCELMYIGMPKNLNSTDTSNAWNKNGRKLLITGTVFKIDGRTPAPDVILYYWQTDAKGLYWASEGLDDRVKRHGDIRGWLKTGADGKYALYTIRPGAYPGSENPEHIHISVKEPDINEYYIDELVFDNDPFLTPDIRKRHENRGGSGILKTARNNGIETAQHDIILGLNIPNYPK